MMTARRAATPFAALGLLLFSACGSNQTGTGPTLSPTAEQGRSVARTNGCASCHGADGGGGVGPAFAGLFGSEVPLDDGTTATADETYLRRSIDEPGAQKVAGYALNMPTNNLSDAEIDQVVAYIIELAGDEQTDSAFDLSPTAAAGQAVSRESGCASCHGSNGQGGLASPFVGLVGSEIELDDGSTVVADEAFVRAAIVDPDVQIAADTRLPMPSNSLSDDEVDQVVAYIFELAQEDAS